MVTTTRRSLIPDLALLEESGPVGGTDGWSAGCPDGGCHGLALLLAAWPPREGSGGRADPGGSRTPLSTQLHWRRPTPTPLGVTTSLPLQSRGTHMLQTLPAACFLLVLDLGCGLLWRDSRGTADAFRPITVSVSAEQEFVLGDKTRCSRPAGISSTVMGIQSHTALLRHLLKFKIITV